MALVSPDLDILLPEIAQLRAAANRRLEVLSLGYPAILLNDDQAGLLFGPRAEGWPAFHPRSDEVLAQHGVSPLAGRVFDADDLFRQLGCNFTSLDLHPYHGTEAVQDLNQPLDPRWTGAFDLVIDPGTIEHCFNILQVMKNLVAAVRVGGSVYHSTPMVYPNHGYFSFSPIFFLHFYSQNGFRVMEQSRFGDVLGPAAGVLDFGPRSFQNGTMSLVLARKLAEVEITLPENGNFMSVTRSQVPGRSAEAFAQLAEQRRIALFPCGAVTRALLAESRLAKAAAVHLLDNFCHGTDLDGLPIQDPEGFDFAAVDLVYVTKATDKDPLLEQLARVGVPVGKIIRHV